MLATLISSLALVPAGRLADRDHLRWVAAAILVGLAAASAAMAVTPGAWMLLPVFLGLRFLGQGMLTQVALTAMARWFETGRGKAIAVAAMGNPASQAVLPIAALAMSQAIGWRLTWLACALFLLVFSVPVVLVLLRREPGAGRASHAIPAPSEAPGPECRQWTRAEALRDPVFWLVIPGLAAPSFVVTGVFFNQAAIVASKSWALAWFVSWFALNAGATIAATLLTGWAVDRFGAVRILPVFLLPQAAGAGLLAMSADPGIIPVVMVLLGLTLGSGSTLLGAVWAELYGTRHIGSIRAVAASAGVFASALAPGLMGVLLDLAVPIANQLVAMAALTIVVTVLGAAGATGALRRARG
jgi:MFS family permease